MDTSKSERPRTYFEMQKEVAEQYQDLFNFFDQEHGIVLTQGEMDDIIQAVKEHLANDSGEASASHVRLNTLVSTTAAEELPVELEIEGETMRFIAFPTKDGGWNCGYISEDLQTTFVNEEPFINYETLEAAAKACKRALQTKGYLRP